MKCYKYTGLQHDGERTTGTMWAESTQEVHHKVKREGIQVIEIEEVRISSSTWTKKKVIAFSYQMALLLEAGISLRRIMTILVERPKAPDAYVQLNASLQRGHNLSMALRETGFPALGQTLVEAGEMSGNLGPAFRFIMSYYNKEKKWQSQVQSAMSYPLFLLVLMTVFFLVAIIFILPSFQKVFATMNVELPLLTRMLFAMGDMVTHHILELAAILLTTGLGLSLLWKQESYRYRFHRWLWLHLYPKGWFHSYYYARMTTVWAMLLDSGVSLLEALKVSQPLWGQPYAKDVHGQMVQHIEEGQNFGMAIQGVPLGSPFLLELITMGEETGELVQLLQHASSYYEEQMDRNMARLGQYMEPCMISCMGIGVGTLVVAVMLPMFRSISALTNL